MLGFAIIKDDGRTIAVWLVSRDGTTATNTNAFVAPSNTAERGPTISSLVRGRVVLGSTTTLERLDIRENMSLGLDELKSWDQDRQALQLELNSFVKRTNKNWKIPFQDTALVPFPPMHFDEAKDEALAVADYLGKVWTRWLTTETERVKRAVEDNNRVPVELSSTAYRGVLVAGLEGHQWVGSSSLGSTPIPSREAD